MSRTSGGAYQSGGKPVEKLKPPPKGPGLGATDHAKCHADIDMLLAELDRLRAVLRMCAEAGREAGEALTYRAEKIAQCHGRDDA